MPPTSYAVGLRVQPLHVHFELPQAVSPMGNVIQAVTTIFDTSSRRHTKHAITCVVKETNILCHPVHSVYRYQRGPARLRALVVLPTQDLASQVQGVYCLYAEVGFVSFKSCSWQCKYCMQLVASAFVASAPCTYRYAPWSNMQLATATTKCPGEADSRPCTWCTSLTCGSTPPSTLVNKSVSLTSLP